MSHSRGRVASYCDTTEKTESPLLVQA